jgi:superoxide dismutase, Fe-Mn family
LRPDAPSAPPAELRAKIDADFGELDAMKKAFDDAAVKRFGSGWAFLSFSPEDGKLFVSSTPNQQNPLMTGIVAQPGIPILGLDVWEHACTFDQRRGKPSITAASS